MKQSGILQSKKLGLIASILSFTLMGANASDCVMAKELNVQFNNGTTVYVDKALEMGKIKEFSNFAKKHNLYVLVEGHTSSLSSAKGNYNLSVNRANKVKKAISSKGLASSHIKALGFGETTPLYDNSTKEGAKKNRRVVAEIFGSAEELNKYVASQKSKIAKTKYQEQ
jgi:outer membrane protein OmpA-like peptidoglycan-associated protein